jgi:hypothetical protein
MDVRQLRKRLKKRAERSRAAYGKFCPECGCQYSWLGGAAQAFDLGATFSPRSPYADPKLDWAAKFLDAEALGSDWARAGGLLWEALDTVTDDLDDETLIRIIREHAATGRGGRHGLSPDTPGAKPGRAVATTSRG